MSEPEIKPVKAWGIVKGGKLCSNVLTPQKRERGWWNPPNEKSIRVLVTPIVPKKRKGARR